MARKKRRSVRDQGLVEFVKSFGFLPRPITHGEYIGLLQNGFDVRMRRVYDMGLAMSHAQSLDDVPDEIAMAACDDKAQARRIANEINMARGRARKGF